MHILVKRSKQAADVDVLVAIWENGACPAGSRGTTRCHLGGVVRDYLDSGDFPGTLNSTLLLRSRRESPAPSPPRGSGRPCGLHARSPPAERVLALPQPCANWSRARGLCCRQPVICPCQTSVRPSPTLLGLYSLKKYKSTAGDEAQDHLHDISWQPRAVPSKVLPTALSADVFWQKQ